MRTKTSQRRRLDEEVVYELNQVGYRFGHPRTFGLQVNYTSTDCSTAEVTGMTSEFLGHCTEVLLTRSTEMTGCPISI